jgi:hypothetical protein
MRVLWGAVVLTLVSTVGAAQSQRDPNVLLKEAERLA